jgi:peptidyl-prolyl cis-trans isomerase A (cyclophilin A)
MLCARAFRQNRNGGPQVSTATFVTSQGTFTVRLMPEHAPNTVANFIELAIGKREWRDPRDGVRKSEPLYDGTVLHRVIPDFMIQGGDPEGTGRGGPGYRFEDEVPPGGPKFDRPGLLAMANAGPNTNGSQFFVTVAATPWLTGKHTIFGEVTDGMDVVEAISQTETDRDDRPSTDVTLERVEVKEG